MPTTLARSTAAVLLALAFVAGSTTAAHADDRVGTNQLYPNGCNSLCLYTNPWWAGSQVDYTQSASSYGSGLNNKISAYFNNTDCAVDFYNGANFTGTKTTVAAGSMSYWISSSTNDTWSSHRIRC
jgi:hypothetical protein